MFERATAVTTGSSKVNTSVFGPSLKVIVTTMSCPEAIAAATCAITLESLTHVVDSQTEPPIDIWGHTDCTPKPTPWVETCEVGSAALFWELIELVVGKSYEIPIGEMATCLAAVMTSKLSGCLPVPVLVRQVALESLVQTLQLQEEAPNRTAREYAAAPKCCPARTTTRPSRTIIFDCAWEEMTGAQYDAASDSMPQETSDT